MVDKIELTKEQKREWQTYSKILRWYSTHLIKLSLIEVEALKRYHFRQPLPIPGNGIERYRIEGLFEYSTFINIILDPDYSKNCIEKVEAVPGKGNCASRWPVYANSIFKETSFEVFAGCTEKVLNCLVKNRHDNAEMWNVGFGPWVHDLITDCTEWLKHGGYRQYPIVPLIPVMFESFTGRISPENYTEKRFSRQIDLYSGIFNFQDPEDLPPEQSSYYYFASHAQHYLCKEATLPEALEQYIIKTTGLNVERLSDHECLPILPRPACYDEVPPIVKPSAKSAKAQEIYDETYPASDDDYPYPPLRYYGQGEVEGKTTLETVLDIFKTHKFYARKPKIKQEDPIHYLSEWDPPV